MDPSFQFSACEYPIFLTPFSKKTVFPKMNTHGISGIIRCLWKSSENPIPLDSMLMFTPVHDASVTWLYGMFWTVTAILSALLPCDKLVFTMLNMFCFFLHVRYFFLLLWRTLLAFWWDCNESEKLFQYYGHFDRLVSVTSEVQRSCKWSFYNSKSSLFLKCVYRARGWRKYLIVKNTGCSSRRPEFKSEYT